MKKFLFVLLLSGLTSLMAVPFMIDASHTRIGFTIKHMMISNVSGDFTSYDGTIDFDPKTMQFKALQGEVDVASVDTGIEKRDNHLRSDDFFNAEKYPKMTLKMLSYKGDAEEGEMEAELTIRDVTKPVKFDVEIGGVANDPWGNTRMGFSMEGKINRQDFGLKWNKVLEAGGFMVDDKVKIKIDVEAILDDTEL